MSYNSEASKYYGEVFSMSPKRLNHLLANYTGGLGTDVVKSVGEGSPKALGFGRFKRDLERGPSIKAFCLSCHLPNQKSIRVQDAKAALKKLSLTKAEMVYYLTKQFEADGLSTRKVKNLKSGAAKITSFGKRLRMLTK